MGIKGFLYEAFEDQDGGPSSKRLITGVFGLAMLTTFLANTFFGTVIDHELFAAISNVVMVGLGATVAEKYSQGRVGDAGKQGVIG